LIQDDFGTLPGAHYSVLLVRRLIIVGALDVYGACASVERSNADNHVEQTRGNHGINEVNGARCDRPVSFYHSRKCFYFSSFRQFRVQHTLLPVRDLLSDRGVRLIAWIRSV
jgi:hypothetical protein